MDVLPSTNYKNTQLKPLIKSLHLENQLSDKCNIATRLSRRYDQLLRSEKYYDCIFHICGMRIKCHKLILCAASPVFEAMFYGPLRENQSEIEILDISPEIFQVLVSYIYTGMVAYDQLTLRDTIELYYSAEKYLVSELISDCLLAITRKLRFSNVLPALELCVCMDLSALLDVCMSFFTRCCLIDPQFMTFHKTHYVHISKECVKAIIAAHKIQKNLLWFVDEWCQHECKELGLQKSDCALIIDDLELPEIAGDEKNLSLKPQQHCSVVERSYFKACRPLTINFETHEWNLYVKCDRFISLRGLIMHSRLAPNVAALAASPLAHIAHALVFPSEYAENLRIEISAPAPELAGAAPISNSDGEEESDQEQANDMPLPPLHDRGGVIWQHSVAKQLTKYNCDLNIRWDEGIVLSPDIEYQIKLIWQSDAYGSEYPCSLQSNVVDGLHFRDADADYGSIVKGLRFINLN